MTGRLQDRVAVITGAGCVGEGWGNGRATAVAFAREGARVLAVDRDAERLGPTVELIRSAGGEVVEHLCDVTDPAAVAAMIDAAVRAFGGLDVLVNNVGGSMPGGPVELATEVWRDQLETNLTSVFLGCKFAVPVLRERGGGAIVNIASTSGISWGGSPHVAYSAAKAGVIQLSRVVAMQHAADRIRVNTVVPGLMHTPLVEFRLAAQRTGGDVGTLLAQRQARIPLGFMGDGRDTAAAVLFLASDEARFITATEIVVDGGMTARSD